MRTGIGTGPGPNVPAALQCLWADPMGKGSMAPASKSQAHACENLVVAAPRRRRVPAHR